MKAFALPGDYASENFFICCELSPTETLCRARTTFCDSVASGLAFPSDSLGCGRCENSSLVLIHWLRLLSVFLTDEFLLSRKSDCAFLQLEVAMSPKGVCERAGRELRNFSTPSSLSSDMNLGDACEAPSTLLDTTPARPFDYDMLR